ncbi:MAG: glycosyltransferase family 2 protein [Nanoarchaeota archaeon]|nr:glycosyltransferase family 2 protein [Nanoarchaeota archaeon]
MIFETILLIITIIPFIVLAVPKKQNRNLNKIDKYPKVSIIISAFNEENIILNTINRILDSNYPKDKLEILVIIDKKTTDKTVKLLKTIKNKKLKVILGKNSKSENIGIGIKNSFGEIIGIYDADCFINKNAIKNAVKYLEDNDGVIGRYYFINERGLIEKFSAISLIQESEIMDKRICQLLDTAIYYGFDAFFKKKIIEKYSFPKDVKSESMSLSSWLSNNNFKIISREGIDCNITVASTLRDNWKQRERWFRGVIGSMKHFFIFKNSRMKITLFFQHYTQNIPLLVLINLFFVPNLFFVLIFANILPLRYMLEKKYYNPLLLLYPLYLAFLGTSIISAYIKEIFGVKFIWHKYERIKNE